ncbi:Predicted Zn-dependent protease [Georgenia satyanarayanai]|uniref:Predicted Zn-dependent protease n=1 Tax=Georgenia satyanarayanai TaxID=860221 RepID=A0A2Y9AY78_9MICO|nr:DUF2268 domain-containing putative Zn-dependent protease [Georgenia satyanarayanai]PYF96337.1 putative Zn-dependent protease DUF2268 [Georgenia satyanarayanai]SSA47059.1 Predicted Zn-dependent protease [Georgenia satyanarayanai]
MTFTVLDSHTAMRRVLTAPVEERATLVRPLLDRAAGMYRYFPGEVDVVEMHHLGNGFRLDREDHRYLPALDRMAGADVWTRIGSALDDALAVQLAATPGITVPDEIVVLLVLGNPDDKLFMDAGRGMSANGSVTGYLWVNVWPTDEVLTQIEAIAVHELHHNLRYANRVWDPATVTVGEHVVSEGLADAFTRQLYGDLGYALVGRAVLDDDAAVAKVLTGLDVTGMEHFTAWVLGDAHATRFGGAPVGLPTGAGYAAGNRLVDAYLAATGQTPADALLADREDVIATARAAGV